MSIRYARTGRGCVPVVAAILLAASALSAQPATSDVSQRVAGYLRAYIENLSILVAKEEFSFRWPKERTIRSDFLLVQYPGAPRNLIPLRDVLDVDGVPIPNRHARLMELFERDFVSARRRADEITLLGTAYVPAVLNPLFVIAFLQEEYQARFRLGVKDAGRGWPEDVAALTFLETARPTLLRVSRTSDANVPTRGTAWIETSTGRILQTELQLNDRGRIRTLVTSFVMDERLGLMVPKEMRSTDPLGLAVYSDFRRFDVNSMEGNFRCVDGKTQGGDGRCFDAKPPGASPTQLAPAPTPPVPR